MILILIDRRVKVRELVEITGISHSTVISILHKQLGDEHEKAIGKMGAAFVHWTISATV